MNKLITIAILFVLSHSVYGQYNQSLNSKNKRDKNKSVSLSLYTGFSNSLFEKKYIVESSYDRISLSAKSKSGSLIGGNLIFQLGKSYGLGIEPVFSSERFDVNGNILKNENFGIGLLHEFKLGNSWGLLIGNQLHFLRSEYSGGGLNNFNLNIGLSYTLKSGLFAGVTYRKSLLSRSYGEEVIKINENIGDYTNKWSNVSAFQFTVGYKFRFNGKSKKGKEEFGSSDKENTTKEITNSKKDEINNSIEKVQSDEDKLKVENTRSSSYTKPNTNYIKKKGNYQKYWNTINLDKTSITKLSLESHELEMARQNIKAYTSLEEIKITGKGIDKKEIIMYHLTCPDIAISYKNEFEDFVIIPPYLLATEDNKEKLLKDINEVNTKWCIELGNVLDDNNYIDLAEELYNLTVGDLKTNNYILHVRNGIKIYERGYYNVAEKHFNKAILHETLIEPKDIFELAYYFESKQIYKPSIRLYKRIGYNEKFSGQSESLISLLSLANIYQQNPHIDSLTKAVTIYEDVCFSDPIDEEAFILMEQGCKKCFDEIKIEIVKLDSIFKIYAQKQEKRIKASAVARTAGNVLQTSGDIVGIFVPGVGAIASGIGNLSQTTAGLTASFLDMSENNIARKNFDIDNEIARLKHSQKFTMERADIEKSKIDEYNEILTSIGRDKETPYINPPTELDEITDQRDGIIYDIVKIDDTWWMAEDLQYKTKGSGKLKKKEGWWNKTKAYKYDVLDNVCPENWHIADTTDWRDLIDHFGGDSLAVKYLPYTSISKFNLNAQSVNGIIYSSYWTLPMKTVTYTKEDIDKLKKVSDRKGYIKYIDKNYYEGKVENRLNTLNWDSNFNKIIIKEIVDSKYVRKYKRPVRCVKD